MVGRTEMHHIFNKKASILFNLLVDIFMELPNA